ncbi:hypothetical protein OIU77_019178 [Salix suchowensis]|uniref:Uncharacterized protein n=2 Tax=Salix TaxID=40685 RepID=A0A9Q0P5Z8_9ROSI|nr:hypothetical protein OIU77_019178 [Salix suchowensis]KAJ6682225.1 hypothetical protein OIU74_020467 [Salix koriyanagi]
MMGQEQRQRQEVRTPDPQHGKLNYRVHGWQVWQSESRQEPKPTIPCSSSDLHQLWPHLSFFPTFTCSHHHYLSPMIQLRISNMETDWES